MDCSNDKKTIYRKKCKVTKLLAREKNRVFWRTSNLNCLVHLTKGEMNEKNNINNHTYS